MGYARAAHVALLFAAVHGKDVVSLFGISLLRRAPLRMYLSGITKGHNRLKAISENTPPPLCKNNLVSEQQQVLFRQLLEPCPALPL